MAQKREKEETELKIPKSMPMCSPPITTAPSKLPGTEDQNIASARLPGSCSDPKSTDFVDLRTINSAKSHQIIDPVDLPESEFGANKLKRKWVSRCSGCKKKLGLMGFRCRCGEMFCSTHRYSDRHECSYDYKAVGREAIARENPVVRAAKIVKI